ncbi:MAG: PD-(D/E)XK nuclease family protein, partial [Bifidobacteriaceae bacterium]|nr:PD-(D/E)XK nuclease family protein [Bifidobacteriaceae bacterium]
YYVGYTRAKYGLIITAHSFSSDKNNTFFNVLEGSGFLDNSDYSSVDSTLNMIAYDDKFDKKIKTLYSNRFDNIYRSEICKKSLEKSTFTVSKHEYSIDDIDGIESQKNQLEKYINSLNDTDSPTMDAAAFGTIIHSILEKSRLQYDEELIELAGTDLTKKDQELAKKIISNLIMNSTTINEAIKSKKVYQELSMGASREFAGENETSEDKTTQAYADLVYLGDDGLWTIADYKNVSVADSLPEYKQQLLIYKDIFEKATGEKVSKIVLIYTFGDSLELVWNFE